MTSHHSFLLAASGALANTTPVTGAPRRKPPVAALSRFYASPTSLRPLTLQELLALMDVSLDSVRRSSPTYATVLSTLFRLLVRPSPSLQSSDASPLTLNETVLYITLRLSPTTSRHFVATPRCELSRLAVKVVEGNRAVLNALQFSCEADPVVDATFISAASDVRRWHRGEDGIQQVTALQAEFSFASVSDPLKDYWADTRTEFMAFLEDSAARSIAPSSSGLTPDADAAGRQNATSPLNASQATAQARHLVIDCPDMYSVFLRDSMAEPAVVALFVATHNAMLGQADPYGITGFSVPNARRPDLAQIAVNPAFIDFQSAEDTLGGGGSTKGASRNPLHAAIAILQEACTTGTLYLRLRAAVAAASRSGARNIVGSYGAAVIGAVRDALDDYSSAVFDSGRLPYGPHGLQFTDILRAALGPLSALRADIATLSQLFSVRDTFDWRVMTTIEMCSSSDVLTRLHRCLVVAASGGHTANRRTASLIRRLLAGSLAPLNKMMTAWLRTGSVEDPFDEFFIAPSDGTTSTGFLVREGRERLPSFISPAVADAFLNAGVSHEVLIAAVRNIARDLAEPQRSMLLEPIVALSREAPAMVVESLLCANYADQSAAEAWSRHFQRIDSLLDPILFPAGASVAGDVDNADGADDADANDGAASVSTAMVEVASSVGRISSVAPSSAAQQSKAIRRGRDASEERDTRAAQMQQQLEAAKEIARLQLIEEHAARMRALELRQRTLEWRTKRKGLHAHRMVALRSVREAIEEVYDDMAATGRQTVAIPWPRAWMGSSPVPTVDEASPAPPPAEIHEVAPPSSRPAAARALPRVAADGAIMPLSLQPLRAEEVEEATPVASPSKADDEGESEAAPQLSVERLPPGARVSRRQLDYELPEEEEEEQEAVEIGAPPELPPPPPPPPEFVIHSMNDLYQAGVGLTRRAAERLGNDDEAAIVATYLRPDEFVPRPWAECEGEGSEWGADDAELSNLFQFVSQLPPAGAAAASGEDSPTRVTRQLAWEVEDAEAARRAALELAHRYAAIAQLASSAFTRRAVRVLLLERHGCLRVMIDALCDVCLMQRGIVVQPLLFELSEISRLTPKSSAGAAFDPFAAYVALSKGFAAAWEATGATRFLALELAADDLAENALARISGTGQQQQQQLPPLPGSPLELVQVLSLRALGVVSHEWLLPPDALRRYGDLFVSLVFWRWAADVLKRIWHAAQGVRVPQVWAFCSLTRSVLSAIMDTVWYGLSRAATDFRSTLAAGVRDGRWSHLGALTMEHDEFLAECFRECLLLPQLHLARKYLRAMVRVIEEVEVAVTRQRDREAVPGGGARAAEHKALCAHLNNRKGVFLSVASKFIEQLESCDEGTSATGNLAAITRAVKPLIAKATDW